MLHFKRTHAHLVPTTKTVESWVFLRSRLAQLRFNFKMKLAVDLCKPLNLSRALKLAFSRVF